MLDETFKKADQWRWTPVEADGGRYLNGLKGFSSTSGA